MRTKQCAVAVALLLLCGQAPAFGNVTMKNGNFFMGYTDVVYPGGFEPKIERVYNSKAIFKGIYGHGWGCEFEVYMTVSASGAIVVHEYGGGAENAFQPVVASPEQLNREIDAIVQAALGAGKITAGAGEAAFRARLGSDATFRNDQWELYRKLQLVTSRQLPLGTVVWSNRYSYQYIKRVRDGYVRVSDDGRLEYFDDGGRLRRVTDRNANYIDLSYDDEGHLRMIVDNFGRSIGLLFNAQGFVAKLEADRGRVATYDYDERGNLVHTVDVDGNEFRYDYDAFHNMTRIEYADGSTMEMAYWARDRFQHIKRVKDRDGTVTSYDYIRNANDKGHLKVTVDVADSTGDSISNSSFEYFLKRDARGGEWLQRLVSTNDGFVTDTVYAEGTGLPLSITQGGEVTNFEYDAKGHVTRKETASEITELRYDPQVDKVAYVARSSKHNPKSSIWSKFVYDPAGNLLFAENSEKQSVRLQYDANGRIESLEDQARRRIEFTYGVNSKPVEIRRVDGTKVQRIKVTYTADGEIEKVESPDGRAVALEVTSAFQNLQDIIRPAGVTLSF
jgi:YD repeat-containing protein